MKKLYLIPYALLRWLIILLVALSVLLVFMLESTTTMLDVLKIPLKEQGLEYGKVKGGLLSGFVLEDVNYKDQVKAKKVHLKVDWKALEKRELVIDDLLLEDAEIAEDFLSSLLENNESRPEESEGKRSLPFDRVVVNNANISVKNIIYDAYKVNHATLHVDHLDTDMKKHYKGNITFLLDSNVSQIDLQGSFENEHYDVIAKIEGEKKFIDTFLADSKIKLFSNPDMTIHAKGDLSEVNYDVDVHRLGVGFEEYRVESQKLHTSGVYHLIKKELVNRLDTELLSNVGRLTLRSDTSLDIDDINNTLLFDIDGKFIPKKSHLIAGLAEENITIEQFPTLLILAKGDMKHVDFSTKVNGLKAKQNEMRLWLKELDLKGFAKPLQGDVDVKAYTLFDSSIADGSLDLSTGLNYKDINNTLVFTSKTNLDIHGAYVNNFLAESNVTLVGDSKVKILAKGDLNHVEFSTSLQEVQGKQNDLSFHLQHLKMKGEANPLQGDVHLIADTQFDSSIAQGLVDVTTTVNYKDINNTLEFTSKADLAIHGAYINKFLVDSNVSLEGDTQLKLTAKGSLEKIEFTTLLKGLKGKQNDISFRLNDLDVKGESNPLQGDTSVVALTHFSSSVVDGEIDAKARLNFHDINESLEIDTIAKLDAHAGFINPLLQEQEMALQGDSHIELKAKGSLEHLSVNLHAKADVLKDEKVSAIRVDSSPIVLNLLSHQVSGSLDVVSTGGDIGLNVKTQFSGDYTKPKEMQVKNKIEIGKFNAFGLNLSSLQPLAMDVQNRDGGLLITLNSPKVNLTAESKDNDYFTFDLKTDQLDISKIMELPEELNNKQFTLELVGDATVSKQHFDVEGFLSSNEGFKLDIDAKNNQNGLNAILSTQHLKVIATGDLAKKNIEAKLSIDSLRLVQEEFVKLYAFALVEVDGALDVDASWKNEELIASVVSPKIMLKDFNIEGLQLDAHYQKDLLTLKRFNFKTRGFLEADLNQDFYLNQKALIHLGEKRDILLDMHPNIYVKAEGTKENLTGDFKIKRLPIGHPEYGSMILNCDINYKQFGLRREILGDIVFNKMKLFYEAKFLDADYDSDVVVITKKDKKKQKERDTFLEDTYIDLSIKAPDAKYKTRDIDLEFTVDVGAKKEFGENLGMVGQIREINGRVEQAPKLFNVIDSNIVFGGGQEINPLLDIQVDYKLPDVLISIFIHGNAKRPKLDFSSEPPMPKKDILSYLILGVSTASLAEGEGSLGREAELFIMNQAARDLAYEVELDRVFIKDDGTGEGYAVQIGKKINDKTMFVIENSKEGNSFILEYEVNKNIKVELGQHQKTVPSQSIDIFFRKKFK